MLTAFPIILHVKTNLHVGTSGAGLFHYCRLANSEGHPDHLAQCLPLHETLFQPNDSLRSRWGKQRRPSSIVHPASAQTQLYHKRYIAPVRSYQPQGRCEWGAGGIQSLPFNQGDYIEEHLLTGQLRCRSSRWLLQIEDTARIKNCIVK